MKIIKRNKSEEEFNSQKIFNAISKASAATPTSTLTKDDIEKITAQVVSCCMEKTHAIDIEDIQNMVEEELMNVDAFDVAKNYIIYRYQRMIDRNSSNLEDRIMSIVMLKNEEVRQENSNKNPIINSTQRDYIAGEVSRDIVMKKMFSKEVVAAHNEGAIHIHDTDYLLQPMYNCSLLNLADMMTNGTVISNTLIEPPKSFYTACNVATQIVAQVASNQYGGQTITLSHLAPYVDISRQKIRKQLEEELAGVSITEEEKNKIVESRVKKEIHNGVQTIQYQVLTLLTTNGQTPFLSVNMYLGEVKDEQTKNDLAMIIEETLLQRIQGVKNEKGVWVTPAFPKLLYVLEEDNIHEDSKYWYLTVLAAKCTAKRMVPDYISEKKMLEYKIDKNGNGNAYPCMGCLEGSEVVSYAIEETKFTESIDRMFERFSRVIPATPQRPGDRDHLYIDLPKGVKIYDNKLNDYVDCLRLISNRSRKWRRIDFGTRCVTVTDDHPFETENRGVVLAKDLLPTDSIYANFSNRDICDFEMFDLDSAWLCGFVAGYTAKFDKFDYTFMEENEVTERVIKAFKTALLMDVSVAPMSDVSIMKHLVPSEADKDRYESFLRGCNHKFDGHNNIDNAIFRWDGEPRIAFVAGLIDSKCYEDCYDSIHLLSREHEMISQFMYLIQSLGIPVEMGIIHGPSDSLKSALYYIDFVPEGKVLEAITDESVKAKFSGVAPRFVTDNIVHPVQIEDFEEDMWSYDVTTSSEHFSFGGIYSHNCRSFLTPYVDENNQPKYYGRLTKKVEPSLNYMNDLISRCPQH